MNILNFLHRASAVSLCLAFVCALTSARAQTTPDSGAIEGRVFNAATGAALLNARVTIIGTGRETNTDESGFFRLSGVQAGEVQIGVQYLGLERQAVTINLPSGQTVQRSFELARPDTKSTREQVIQLATVTVVADTNMSAQAIAMNEQRVSASIKNVVAFAEYGDRGQENVGEFLLFLPGVSVGVAGDAGATGVSLRGMPTGQTGITIDGSTLAGARTNGRAIELPDVPLANLSRVEVTKVPTPDMSAAGLGGAINLIPSNGFEYKKPTFTYNLSTIFHNTNGATFKWPRHHRDANSPKYTKPSMDFTYFHPLNESVAFNVGAAYTWRTKPLDDSYSSRDETPTWDLVDLFQRSSTWSTRTQQYITRTGQVGVAWRITPRTTLSTDFSVKDYSMIVTRGNLNVTYGAGARGDRNFTQGAATGVGLVDQGNGTWYERKTNTQLASLKLRSIGEIWKTDGGLSWSRSTWGLPDVENGHFTAAPARISNLIIRGGDNSPDGMPRRITATTRTGTPVDVYNGNNYSIISGTSAQEDSATVTTSGRLNLSRQFGGTVPFTLKTGIAVERMDRDRRHSARTWDFRPNGATSEDARLAKNFDVFDEEYLKTAKTIHGAPYRSLSQKKVYDLYLKHPDWFVLNTAQAYQNRVNTSRLFDETVSAAYLRGDVRLLANRLWLISGVRMEKTNVSGSGPLDDLNAQYQRAANGNFILNAAGARVLIPTDALGLAKLRYKERGAHSTSDYSGFYPSLNATYTLSDHFVVRAAYARTIGRPDTSFIVPGITISDPDIAQPTITVSNIGLKPWTANNYDLTFESYDFKGGFGQIGVFQKNITDFFGVDRKRVTSELLQFYGLPEDGSLSTYEFASMKNAGDVTVKGVEFGYRQALTFLPHWARGIQLNWNYTRLSTSGSATADLSGFNPKKYSGGISLTRERYSMRLTYSFQDKTRDSPAAVSLANGIPANTSNYTDAYARWIADAQYSFSKRLTVYGMLKDIGGLYVHQLRYTTNTPDYAKGARLQKLGYTLTIGVKGTF
ncbi:MAG: TonB-dependent receptor [Opitutus sp.]|nr:TonB-dependent receptor [Opitutus sp.]